MDHSLLGGEFIEGNVAGQSVYTVFYIQQAVILFSGHAALPKRPPLRALHIGVGAGTSAKGLQSMGVVADTVELHAEIADVAVHYFGMKPLGR
jgi:hypothetical protein